ncbi:hypothetical protein [Pseudoduganella sp. R-34]|uniref:hypothetical protein n=1 Tax=Pseudoduganella sp. R-34 TaxID=3404062 RepID=UPI003CF6F78C
MSKIVQAVNAMVSNPDLISAVEAYQEELFFKYKSKYTWSMTKNKEGIYFLWYYPSSPDIDQLLDRAANEYWENISMVRYRTDEIGTKEAVASFAELYTLLQEKEFGMNEVLDDIISDGDPF